MTFGGGKLMQVINAWANAVDDRLQVWRIILLRVDERLNASGDRAAIGMPKHHHQLGLEFFGGKFNGANLRGRNHIARHANDKQVAQALVKDNLNRNASIRAAKNDGVRKLVSGQRRAALLIMQGGQLRLERYGLGFDAHGRWTSFSVAKSLTSTLVGAALRDGHIRSMDDKVSDYIPAMKGSAYDDVSVRQLLSMTSGVQWNEDYGDPNSDVARFNNHQPEPGADALVSYMRRLPRAAPPGQRWNYSTGETNLVGVLVSQAAKRPIAQYLQEEIWQPVGMEQQATWILSKTGHEISGCCVQAASRDFARFGQFILEGARVDGTSVVPDGWLGEATRKQADIGEPGRGYGYQWWTYDDGSFAARGIFGQGIFIDPKRELVIVSNANWAGGARDEVASAAREDFYRAVQQAVDDEAAKR